MMSRSVKARLNDCVCGDSDLVVGAWSVKCKSCGRTTKLHNSRMAAINAWNDGLIDAPEKMNYREWLDRDMWMGVPRNAPC